MNVGSVVSQRIPTGGVVMADQPEQTAQDAVEAALAASGLDGMAEPDEILEALGVAGYAVIKRARIETWEELADLPVRTVIKEDFPSGNGAIWERWHAETWVRLDSGAHEPGKMPFLPADVLYLPLLAAAAVSQDGER